MSANIPMSGVLHATLQSFEFLGVSLALTRSFVVALIPSIDILYSTFTPPYVSIILYKNALISFRYAAFKRHPE